MAESSTNQILPLLAYASYQLRNAVIVLDAMLRDIIAIALFAVLSGASSRESL
ncbi:hypothetical protein [Sivoneniella epilithica]